MPQPSFPAVHTLGADAISKAFPPALVLAGIVSFAGFHAGLNIIWTGLLVLVGVITPGLVYKKSAPIFARFEWPDRYRIFVTAGVSLGVGASTAMMDLPQPVPATMCALFVGNIGLAFARRWLNASAHVSVISFGALWILSNFGPLWIGVLILSPLMMISRVALKQHTANEAFAGLNIGLAAFAFYLIFAIWS